MSIDLKAFQARLNSDKALRLRFFENPIKTVEEEGLILPAEAKTGLAKAVDRLKKKEPDIPGSTLPEDALQIRVRIHQPG